MLGTVSYSNSSRRFALLTPIGKGRDHDIFCHQIQFDLANIDLPYVGQVVEFSVSPDTGGKLEATDLHLPNSDPVAGIGDRKIDATGGAVPAADAQPVAGCNPETR